ncbi:MAG TPA: O-antigen ligase family protein, partial [Thermoanaerobaculia bacterium]
RRADPRVRARALSAGLWGVTASALAALLQRVGVLPPETRGFWKLTGRLGGGAVDPNSLGILCALALVVALASFRESFRGALRTTRAALLILGLVLSGSRSGFLLLLLALVLLLAVRGVTPRVRIAGFVALAATLILIVMLVLRGAPGTIGGRLAESFDPRLPIAYRVSERPALWRAAIRLFESHPVAGGGMGAFAWKLPDLLRDENRRLPTRDNPGSGYIQALAETGVLGFFLTIGFVLSLAAQMLGRSRAPSDGSDLGAAGAGLVAFLITLALGSHWFAPDVSLLFFLIAATAVAPASSEGRALVAIRRGAVWLYAAAALVGILETARPGETFRYSRRIGFHAAEAGPRGPLRWTRRRFALWLSPGERLQLQLAHFTPEGKPVEVVASVAGTVVWRRSLVPGETAHLVLSGPPTRSEAVVFRVSRSFVPRRLRLSEDRRELGLLSAEE